MFVEQLNVTNLTDVISLYKFAMARLLLFQEKAKDTSFYLHAFSSTRFATFPPTDYLCLRFN